MTGRAFAFTSALLLGALCAQGATSCTTTVTETTPVGPTGAPSLSIASPLRNSCIEIPDPQTSPGIPVTVSVEGTFFLRPPGACVGFNNCGHILLEVGPAGSEAGAPNNYSASGLVDFLPSKLGTPFPYGDLTLTVLLVDDFGNPWLLSDNEAGAPAGSTPGPFSTQVMIHTAVSCGDSGVGDAGSGDGGMSDAGDGGTSDAGDGGMSDAGMSDAGMTDAGSGDAGVTDAGGTGTGGGGAGGAGPGDAGSVDAGDAGAMGTGGAGGAGPGDAGDAGDGG